MQISEIPHSVVFWQTPLKVEVRKPSIRQYIAGSGFAIAYQLQWSQMKLTKLSRLTAPTTTPVKCPGGRHSWDCSQGVPKVKTKWDAEVVQDDPKS